MKKVLLILALCLPLFFTGCARIDPFSPDLNQRLDNQDGEINDLQNNQNGFMLELGKLRNEQQILSEKIDNLQQGIINKNNSGVQILQGDGPLIALFAFGVLVLMLVFYYKNKADKNEEAADILAQQINQSEDEELRESVFGAALNSRVEGEVYAFMQRN